MNFKSILYYLLINPALNIYIALKMSSCSCKFENSSGVFFFQAVTLENSKLNMRIRLRNRRANMSINSLCMQCKCYKKVIKKIILKIFVTIMNETMKKSKNSILAVVIL